MMMLSGADVAALQYNLIASRGGGSRTALLGRNSLMGLLTRRLARISRVLLLGGALLLSPACERESSVARLQALQFDPVMPAAVADKTDGELSPRLLRRFSPLPKVPSSLNSDLVRLGRILYFEPLLSRTGKISCNSCHPLNQYGVTNARFSIGIDGKFGRRNAPSVYNTAGHFRQFWDGRAGTLSEQVLGPLDDVTEMGMDEVTIKRVLTDIPDYRELFARAFPHDSDPIRIGNVAVSIAEFERGLITPARWDRYLAGDTQALTQPEKEGAKLFANLGCMVCHTGAYVGGTMFEKLGVFVPWPNQSDHGRRDITHNPADDMVFKVPSLRNSAKTAPYFHDGSAASLDTAVRMMARHQLGVDLSEEEAVSIAVWLGSLTGEIPRDYIATPRLPEAQRP
jgi:cytochrome c peroxidase